MPSDKHTTYDTFLPHNSYILFKNLSVSCKNTAAEEERMQSKGGGRNLSPPPPLLRRECMNTTLLLNSYLYCNSHTPFPSSLLLPILKSLYPPIYCRHTPSCSREISTPTLALHPSSFPSHHHCELIVETPVARADSHLFTRCFCATMRMSVCAIFF